MTNYESEFDSDPKLNLDDAWTLAEAEIEVDEKQQRSRKRGRRAKAENWSEGAIEQRELEEKHAKQPWRRDTKWVAVPLESPWHWSHWTSERKPQDAD